MNIPIFVPTDEHVKLAEDVALHGTGYIMITPNGDAVHVPYRNVMVDGKPSIARLVRRSMETLDAANSRAMSDPLLHTILTGEEFEHLIDFHRSRASFANFERNTLKRSAHRLRADALEALMRAKGFTQRSG